MSVESEFGSLKLCSLTIAVMTDGRTGLGIKYMCISGKNIPADIDTCVPVCTGEGSVG